MGVRVLSVLSGVGSGLLVVLLLSPKSCTDSIPPICTSAFGYTVPGGSWWIAAALTSGLLVGWVVGAIARRSGTPGPA
jgi:hypothetical protein